LPVSETTNTKRYKNIHREKERKKERIHLMKTEIRNSITRLILIPLVLTCFALLPSVQATPDPANPGGANTADGANALQNRTTGEFNTAFGTNALFSLTTGSNNGAQGNSALFSLTTGNGNSAVGSIALRFLTIGNHNVAIGNTSLNNITTGSRNTAVGYGTNRSGNNSDNTTVGWSAMISNTTGPQNVAVGSGALESNTTGDKNVAVGFEALSSNTTAGNASNALGYRALRNSNGSFNNAFGWLALGSVTGGDNNTAMGDGAGFSTTGSTNSFFGANAGSGVTTASGVVCLGSISGANQDNRTFVRNLTNNQIQTFNGGTIKYVTVEVATGRLGITAVVSSRRYKYDIKPMDKVSEGILALKPVTFRVKKEVDTSGLPGFGLIAEDVEAVNPDLVYHDEQGRPESVRYDAVNALLLNEFLKEHRKNEEQEATIARQQKQIEALTVGLQKVSAQVEASKPAPQMVGNNR
jgi:hypothetical protein